MGNCIRKESSMQFGGEDWGLPETNEDFYCHKSMKLEDDHLLMGENKESIHTSTPGSAKEIKIKITKKQLSELMGKAEVQGISLHQLLTQLMKVSESLELCHRSWSPALHSIPEDN
ncbi:PREDICTED: uncharacterized protein LOC109209197 [Nicotiana attenuata]|uniref:Uncharacterized protein n=1 Tax=Nicotiana attenuata TaxID=49451 RepID=A0A314KQH9_NICAT|nr:PREDICTED: uncharacterized protein LOC109209197 [Nicotiana attenuata]OIT31059.1 hypothetical protein A4A49_31094 [Nicotiana attenuata]